MIAGLATPACLNTSLPFLNAINVGNSLTPAIETNSCSVPKLTLPCTMSGCLSDEPSYVGVNTAHGAHSGAQT
ncbi:hypothetical protein A4G26_12455 [Mycobacterium kansasii]|uniref:Uncharacterized protein n=1 Tax=Mycobacterium innocens TaxID=2341083 RepID=A0A498Q2A0_9MYCO|nr:hypothetical protein A4G26_12455 [Mycobacterium kansasii]VBA38743.1 hypothetical protein LAUMK13_02251 [Mycobacterium innocens]